MKAYLLGLIIDLSEERVDLWRNHGGYADAARKLWIACLGIAGQV